MMFWYGSHWVFWQALLMWLFMIALWGFIIWAIWYFVSSAFRDSHRDRRDKDARAILDERLARGEIDTEEYRRLNDLIRGRSSVGAGDSR
jgi:putative membrane protein